MIASPVAQPQDVYTDLNSLQSINDIGREDKGQALQKVAEQFESMFVKMMMKSMRDANKVFQEDSIMHSPQEDFYQQMYDDQMSVSLTGKQGIGLADVIYRQLNQEYGDSTKRENIEWKPLDDRRKHFSHAVDFAPVEKKSRSLNSVEEASGFEIDSSVIHKTSASLDTLEKPNNKVKTFDTPEQFIQQLYPAAKKIADDMGVSPKAIISQAALETGWGQFMIHGKDEHGNKENSFNFFGIKADSRWSGEKVSITTHEYREGKRISEKADFRSYTSIEAGLNDYAKFLKDQRYEKAMAAGKNVEKYAIELQKAGYATDPQYAQKINRIASSELMNSIALPNVETSITPVKTSSTPEVPRG